MIPAIFLTCALASPMAMADHPMNLKEHTQILNFLTAYRMSLKRRNIPRRALLMGFHSPLPMMDFLIYGDFKPFGVSHFPFPHRMYHYVQAEYDFMPYMANAFALVVAPDLHVWHVRKDQTVMMDDFHIAMELSRIIIPGGYFIANMTDLRGFALHLVHVGFSRLETMFGNAEVWQKDQYQAPSAENDEKEQSVRDWIKKHRKIIDRYDIKTNGHHNDAKQFIGEYHWLHNLLESMFPGNEFIIMPDRLHIQIPEGWTYVILHWRNHIIYRRPKPDMAGLREIRTAA